MPKSTNTFQTVLNTPMTAKRLVLGLFGALDDETLPIAKLIVGGSVFDIEETAMRMAANRLVNEGVLELITRGSYGIGTAGASLYEASRAWQQQGDRLRQWTGSWICVHVSHLGKSNRKALRIRRRAFTLCGFAELEDGLWLRPGNLTLSLPELASELHRLGLEREAFISEASEIVHENANNMNRLWDRTALEASYQSALAAMEQSQATLKNQPLQVAAREVHEVGSSVVSVLTHDPLLPSSLVDTQLRQRVYDTMLSYNELGKAVWMELFEESAQKQSASAG